jgi:hypothetical protein
VFGRNSSVPLPDPAPAAGVFGVEDPRPAAAPAPIGPARRPVDLAEALLMKEVPGRPPAIDEPTQVLPVVATRQPRRPPPNGAAARAVIVYQERPRRPWLLWAFTVVLVALTVGVVLGQTIAFEPTYRSTANAQTAPPVPSPAASSPPAAGGASAGATASGPSPAAGTPIPLNEAWPDAQHHVTAPLGTVKTRVLEVTGPSTTLRLRGADLGDTLLDAATTDRSAVPRLTATKGAEKLELIQTGDPGTVGAEIRLNAKVTWTIRLTGGVGEQTVDLQTGHVAGIRLAGGTANVVLLLPQPKGTVPLSLTGPVGQLILRTRTGTPVRVRLGAGAATATLDGKIHQKVKPATTSPPPTPSPRS